MKFFNLEQKPIMIKGWYDEDTCSGLIEEFFLSKSKSMESMHIYMFVRYNIKLEMFDCDCYTMIFDENKILFSFDPDVDFVNNVILEIKDVDTFNKFLYMFDDDEYTLKVHKKKIKFYKKDTSDWFMGAEIEMKMSDEFDTPEYRNAAICKLNQKYGDIIYTQAENFRRQFIEIITYPLPPSEMYKIHNVINYARELHMDLDWSCNFQLHVCKHKLGKTREIAVMNANKILLFMYNTDSFCKTVMFNKTLIDWDLCPTILDVIHNDKYIGDKTITDYEKYNMCTYLLESQSRIRKALAPYLNVWRLFNDFENESTLEFRLSDLITFDKKRILLPVAYVEFCIEVVCSMDIYDVDKITIDDFLRFYEERYQSICNSGDYDEL